MGFGHRVYKNYDPRAKIMQKLCHEVLKETGQANDPVLQVALEFERILLSDDYFISRKLYPNVDFYSGITLKALGFPTSMFTVLFAVARTVGWIAQWKEMIGDPNYKIAPPAPALHRRRRAPVHAARQAQVSERSSTAKADATASAFSLGALSEPECYCAPGRCHASSPDIGIQFSGSCATSASSRSPRRRRAGSACARRST